MAKVARPNPRSAAARRARGLRSVVVWLDGEDQSKLALLRAHAPGQTAADVIRSALDLAALAAIQGGER